MTPPIVSMPPSTQASDRNPDETEKTLASNEKSVFFTEADILVDAARVAQKPEIAKAAMEKLSEEKLDNKYFVVRAWEMKGKYPEILRDPVVGKEARDLFDKAQAMLQSFAACGVAARSATPQAAGVYGFFPANADGDDIVLYTDDTRSHEAADLQPLRSVFVADERSTR